MWLIVTGGDSDDKTITFEQAMMKLYLGSEGLKSAGPVLVDIVCADALVLTHNCMETVQYRIWGLIVIHGNASRLNDATTPFKGFKSLWNLADASVAMMPRRLPNFRAM